MERGKKGGGIKFASRPTLLSPLFSPPLLLPPSLRNSRASYTRSKNAEKAYQQLAQSPPFVVLCPNVKETGEIVLFSLMGPDKKRGVKKELKFRAQLFH